MLVVSLKSYSNENLLTIQQQVERLQREVSDLSQSLFSKQENSLSENNNDFVTNLSAIDMRIYDLEKDVKFLTSNLEEISFQIDDLITKINNLDILIKSLEDNFLSIKIDNTEKKINTSDDSTKVLEENSLGSLKITSTDSLTNDNNQDLDIANKVEDKKLSPEDQFQSAFDNIRSKNWEIAKSSFIKFIQENPDNQLSGSAHYWLGELYVLEDKHRDAALIFAEGFQKFPKSIKAPDMLFKLSQSLQEVDKKNESCKTLEKLILDYPKNKFIQNANKLIKNYGCLEVDE